MKLYPEKKPLNPITAQERALVATALFIAFGVVGYVVAPPTPFLPITAIFYVMMLWNTFYSVNHFSSIVPAGDLGQMVTDVALVLVYLLLALSLWSIFYFDIILVILFALATIKYTIALPKTEHPELLYRKLKMDGMGTIASGLALVGIVLGYPFSSILAWTILFAMMSVYVILVRPLYQKPA